MAISRERGAKGTGDLSTIYCDISVFPHDRGLVSFLYPNVFFIVLGQIALSSILSQTFENSSVALELQLKSWEEIQRIAKNLSATTASAQEASRMCDQIL